MEEKMYGYRKRVLVVVFSVLVLSVLVSTTVIAQDETSGFSEDFDTINWEEWERSQDVSVENGVLKISPGNFVLRFGDWSEIDLDIRLRFTPPGEVVVNYYLRDEGHYALILLGDVAILEKNINENPTKLGEGQVQTFYSDAWNDINIKVEGGKHAITINQVEVITATDSEPLTTGAILLHAFGESAAEFDSMVLSGIPGGGPIPEGSQPGEEVPPPEEGEAGGVGEQPPEGQLSAGDTQGPTPIDGTSIGDESGTTQSLIAEFMSGQSNQLELTTFLMNLFLAVVTSFILGRVYVYWGSSLSNRRAFASNFMLLTVTTTFIILVVRSSVALSLGLVGALSIVRFRAAIKEPEELAYLFFAISLGIGLGDNQRLITLLALLVGIAVIGLLRLFRSTGSDVNLHLTISSQNPNKVDLDQITKVLERHCSKIKLLRFDETEKVLETSYVIEFKRVSDLSKAKAELQTLSPLLEISFLDNKGIW